MVQAKEAWSAACDAGPGRKRDAQMAVIKAWALDRSWGKTFMTVTQEVSQSKSAAFKEKPDTRW
jgi:hypothetical protein